MITMFGKTSEEILDALHFYDIHHMKKSVRKFENVTVTGHNFRLETRSDTGLTLWVNGQVVYNHKEGV